VKISRSFGQRNPPKEELRKLTPNLPDVSGSSGGPTATTCKQALSAEHNCAAQPITAAEVLRVGMHTFPGWGAEPVTDEAAEVGELPETAEEDQRIFWYQFAPAVAALAVPIFLLCVPGWLATLRGASAHFSQQAAMLHWIYTGSQVHTQNIAPWEVGTAEIHGGVAFLLAVLLACTRSFEIGLPGRFASELFWNPGSPRFAPCSPVIPAITFSGSPLDLPPGDQRSSS
jgi:hypothetical protein